MRHFINIVENITRYKDKQETSIMGDLSNLFSVAPSSETAMVLNKTHDVAMQSPQAQALQASSSNMLADLEKMSSGYEDDYDDSTTYGEIEPTETPPNTLPATVNKDVVDQNDFNPTWHLVGNLPGMMLKGIRMVASKIFNEFTRTPLAEIQMMTTVFGINDQVDVMKMMSLIRKHGVQQDVMSYDFSEHMPSYHKITPNNDAQLWSAFDRGFFVLKDAGGYYIYSWPSSDTNTTKAIT